MAGGNWGFSDDEMANAFAEAVIQKFREEAPEELDPEDRIKPGTRLHICNHKHHCDCLTLNLPASAIKAKA